MPESPRPLVELSPDQLRALATSTVSHYDQNAVDFREGTKDHDVSQNVNALRDVVILRAFAKVHGILVVVRHRRRREGAKLVGREFDQRTGRLP
ncbi:MAG: hypothetical protein AAF645_27085, partial [Myxococcota bacterium]